MLIILFTREFSARHIRSASDSTLSSLGSEDGILHLGRRRLPHPLENKQIHIVKRENNWSEPDSDGTSDNTRLHARDEDKQQHQLYRRTPTNVIRQTKSHNKINNEKKNFKQAVKDKKTG